MALAPQALEALAQRRIFFGHQSVGRDILQGVQAAAAQRKVALPVVESAQAAALARPGFSHAAIGRNEDPRSKLAHFERLLGEGLGERADIALLKFCYIDFDARTAVEPLFAEYRATLQRLRAAHPRVTFVHVTVPLTVVQRGPRALARRLLGRPVWGEAENVRRHQFNELLRGEYAGREPLFDLAGLESVREDGSREEFAREGRAWPALVPAYSDDGQHLNARGQARAGQALLALLAGLPVAPQAQR